MPNKCNTIIIFPFSVQTSVLYPCWLIFPISGQTLILYPYWLIFYISVLYWLNLRSNILYTHKIVKLGFVIIGPTMTFYYRKCRSKDLRGDAFSTRHFFGKFPQNFSFVIQMKGDYNFMEDLCHFFQKFSFFRLNTFHVA